MARTDTATVEAFLGLTPLYPSSDDSPPVAREDPAPALASSASPQSGADVEDGDEAATGTSTGQGRGLTGPERKTVERRAMDLAMAHYREKGFEVEDVGATESFDLRCRRNGSERRVEVKGTTGGGESVFLTFNEVKHARSLHRVALFVVSHIQLEDRDTEAPTATGGDVRVIDPWDVRRGTLKVETYRYTLP